MTCDRYWDEQVLSSERGLPDPHREECATCRREHAARVALVRHLRLLGRDRADDPGWQARVWRRIDRPPTAGQRRGLWARAVAVQLAAAGAIAAAAALITSPVIPSVRGRLPAAGLLTGASQIGGDLQLGTSLEARAAIDHQIWIYRGSRLHHRCALAGDAPSPPGARCRWAGAELVAHLPLDAIGPYRVLVVADLEQVPLGQLDRDAAAALRRGSLALDRPFTVK